MPLTNGKQVSEMGNLHSDLDHGLLTPFIREAEIEIKRVVDDYANIECAITGTDQGTWNASTNTPTLADGGGTKGHFYKVSAAGTVDFGDGDIAFVVDDLVVYNSDGEWKRIQKGKKDDVQYAEAYWALSLAIIPLNSRSDAKGGFIRSTGFGDNQNSLLSVDDAKTLAGTYRERAGTFLQSYIQPADDPSTEAVDPPYASVGSFGIADV